MIQRTIGYAAAGNILGKVRPSNDIDFAVRNHLDHDFVIVHDPQPLPMVGHYDKQGPWIWRCHVGLSRPNASLWNYLKTHAEKYDEMIVSMDDYLQASLRTPQKVFHPAIDPFSMINRDLSETEAEER